ncbi:MAG: type II secretion system F family protein [Eubacterium sp.]|nr:type II secretion system F family protein [Eubacterium sp.]
MVQFLVIAYSLFALCVVVLLLSRKGQEEDNNLRRKRAIGKETVKADYKNVNTSFTERIIKPIVDKITQSDRYGENATKSERQRKNNEILALKLRKAGFHLSAASFSFFKTGFMIIVVIMSIGLGLILYSSSKYAIFVTIIGIVIGILGPDVFLMSRVKSHQTAIKDQLADTIDLMSVCMEAGLSFDASLVKVSERMEGPLIDELITVFRQIQLGKNRNEALKALADSSDVKELKTFVSAIIQAGSLGIPITNVLDSQAEQLRMNKAEEIKEVAAKVPTKMTIPTVLLILPAIFCVILGPVVFSVMDNMKGAF